MLSGSAILRISLVLLVAGCLAALVQYFLPHAAPAPDVPAPATVTPAPRRIETAPAPQPSATLPRAPDARSAPLPSPPPRAEMSAPPPTLSTPPAAQPAEPMAPRSSQPTGQAAVDEANDSAGPRALALVDLNTASLAELNRMRGGGNIGRAIIQRRPYAAIDQLLSKRVLGRATYDRIKDQITVR